MSDDDIAGDGADRLRRLPDFPDGTSVSGPLPRAFFDAMHDEWNASEFTTLFGDDDVAVRGTQLAAVFHFDHPDDARAFAEFARQYGRCPESRGLTRVVVDASSPPFHRPQGETMVNCTFRGTVTDASDPYPRGLVRFAEAVAADAELAADTHATSEAAIRASIARARGARDDEPVAGSIDAVGGKYAKNILSLMGVSDDDSDADADDDADHDFDDAAEFAAVCKELADEDEGVLIEAGDVTFDPRAEDEDIDVPPIPPCPNCSAETPDARQLSTGEWVCQDCTHVYTRDDSEAAD